MKLYIVTYNSIINGEQNRGVLNKCFRTKEAAKDAMNNVYEYWLAGAEKYINSGHIVKHYEDDFFLIYNLFKPEGFTVDCTIYETELTDEDNNPYKG